VGYSANALTSHVEGSVTAFKELSIYRLTQQALRKVLHAIDGLSLEVAIDQINSHVSGQENSHVDTQIHNAIAVLDVTDQLLKDIRLGTGTGRPGKLTVSALSAQAREYLDQYNQSGNSESMQKSIQLAKSAYEVP
jgi:hypothetical protein